MRLEFTDGRAPIEAPDPLPIDLVLMERHFRISASVLAQPNAQRIDYALHLAYTALKRTHQLPDGMTYDAFLESLADFQDDEDATLEQLREARDKLSERIDAMEQAAAEGSAPLEVAGSDASQPRPNDS